MTTTSVTAVDGFGGNAASRASSARSDSGLFVGAPSVVRLPPRNKAITAIERTATIAHAPSTRQGWRALAAAGGPVLTQSTVALAEPSHIGPWTRVAIPLQGEDGSRLGRLG